MQEIVGQGLDFVMRFPQSNFKEFQAFMASNSYDGVFNVQRKSSLPLLLRIVRYKIQGKSYFLVTSLTSDKLFPRKSLQELYHQRWGVEEFFKTLKQDARIEDFCSKSKNGILQELYAFLILHSLSRLAELQTTGGGSKNRPCNHRHSTTLLLDSFPKLICKNVRNEHCLIFYKNIALARYQAYGGRSFPRVSYKPSSRWRKTAKLQI